MHDGHPASGPPKGAADNDRSAVVLSGLTVCGTVLAGALSWIGALPEVASLALIVVYLTGGLPSGIRALAELWHDQVLDVDLLMVVAALAAAVVGAPLEGAVLLMLFSVSETLEHMAMGKARRAVEALMALRPETALRLGTDGKTEEVAVDQLCPGDTLVLRPGSRVPVDGTIVSGEGALNEATVTGESVPVRKGPGRQVFEATVNVDAVLQMRVDRTLSESTVARMIELVTQAQAAKAPSERFSTWFGQRYTVVVLVGSMLAFGAFLGLGWTVQDALYRAATLLVAASPCAIVISVPAAILSALSAAARGGVLFKGGAALETLGSVRSFAFDKTGTLTTGEAAVTGLTVIEGSPAEGLALLAGVEAHSEHHIAAAIHAEAVARGVAPLAVRDVAALPSEGITGVDAQGMAVWAGNSRMVERMGAGAGLPALDDVAADSQTVVYFGRGATILGAATIADQPRPTSAQGIAALRRSGIRTLAMMTGDRDPVAQRIGRDLGLLPSEIHADLLPQDKVRLVAALAEQGPVAFVGDGVNDAAALARADVGIAMGAAGSEVALQAADVALMSTNMERLAAAHALARRTGRIIRQNLSFAIGAMVLLMIGALAFNLPLPLAVLGHEGGTLLVVLNGLRLLADPIRADRAA